MRTSTIVSNTQQFLGIDVTRTRSTESTEDTSPFRTPSKITQTRASPSSSSPSLLQQMRMPQRPTKNQSWRTKELMGSIFRSPPNPQDDLDNDIPDMFSIKRCLAFDEGDSDGEE